MDSSSALTSCFCLRTSLLTISLAYTTNFYDMYINGKENANWQAAWWRLSCCPYPLWSEISLRQRYYPEDVPRYPKISFHMICISLLKCRLSSSFQPLMQHCAALHCTAFPTFLTQVMALWRYSFYHILIQCSGMEWNLSMHGDGLGTFNFEFII